MWALLQPFWKQSQKLDSWNRASIMRIKPHSNIDVIVECTLNQHNKKRSAKVLVRPRHRNTVTIILKRYRRTRLRVMWIFFVLPSVAISRTYDSSLFLNQKKVNALSSIACLSTNNWEVDFFIQIQMQLMADMEKLVILLLPLSDMVFFDGVGFCTLTVGNAQEIWE